ncbi:hypothetical protein AF332_07150 [Sporosarcina globispora]|uniref:Uncharacterized protein n=1 Tax=Sporosarcina globispora TaxID=1459 RepID=A0A0M0GB05_SPOGL|nr:hypothetical protein AF332_07150 [Sporosarcina globispora]
MIVRFLIDKILIYLGDEIMMAMFFAQRVILGKTAFEDVPESLKPATYEHLVDSGVEFLAGDYQPPSS